MVQNHEHMIAELSKALCKIAMLLPRVEMQLDLYQQDDMKVYAEVLYAEIIQFNYRALKWYEDGKLKHMLGAFINPFKLRFKDICDKIDECSRNIEKLAAVYAQKELRKMNLLTESSSMTQRAIVELLIDIRTKLIGKRSFVAQCYAYYGPKHSLPTIFRK
jgi:hypothetical protein